MNHRQALIGVVIGVAAVALGWVLMTNLSRTLRTIEQDPIVDAPPQQTTPPATPAVPRIKAVLFFASEDGRGLVGVEQEVPLAEGTVPQARALVEAQLRTAPPSPLVSTIPEGTTLRGLFVSSRNEAFVDLDATIRDRHPGGSMNELFTVYTIVNAVTTNLPDVQTVQVLIDGREVDTLAGHVDLRRPLRKNEALILP
ncbi:MAG TPA: GerMN domain-containing protein [Vicinamibacterales bacterium]|nr:GerMN domain-containing protein [Vicinamibacterales bacterium]